MVLNNCGLSPFIQQLPQCLTAMAERVLYLRGQFSGTAMMRGHEEQRVVAKTLSTGRRLQNQAFPRALAHQRHGIGRKALQHDDALEARGAFGAGDAFHS